MTKAKKRKVRLGDLEFGSPQPIMMAGPCSVESEAMIHRIASRLSQMGVRVLRGGCFKARTSPYSFQGLGEEGLKFLVEAAKANSMYSVVEFLTIEQLEEYADLVDIVQIGTRNMYNYPFLKACGQLKKPVVLKRAFSATYEEWHMASEYILSEGNEAVILCERGIRTFEVATRNTLDITAIAYMKERTGLPVIVDPSHAAGLRELVPNLAYASMAAGADGFMLECHEEPEKALSDSRQSLSLEDFEEMYQRLRRMEALRMRDWKEK